MLFISKTLHDRKITLGKAEAPARCDSNVNARFTVIVLLSSPFGGWILALRQRVQVLLLYRHSWKGKGKQALAVIPRSFYFCGFFVGSVWDCMK